MRKVAPLQPLSSFGAQLPSQNAFACHLEDVFMQLSSILASIHLSAYASDAMRVLQALERQAVQSQDFHATIRAVCPDWRNPGSLQDPADCISTVLSHSAHAMDRVLTDMRRTLDDAFNP